MHFLSSLFTTLQQHLFPFQQEALGELCEKHKTLIEVAELASIEKFMSPFGRKPMGRPRHGRQPLVLAFLAKAVWNCPTTRALLDLLGADAPLRRLCGWETRADLPSEATFSRAFDEFARTALPQAIHEAMVKKCCGPKLAGHTSRDSTPILGREKAARKESAPQKSKARRGRPKKGEERAPKPPRRLEQQGRHSLEENLQDLPTACDRGSKKDSKGFKKSWIGYKLHVDCIDGDIPVSTILTSASLHDSQAAIPLAQMTGQRLTNLYDLMDSAYDAPEIKAFSEGLGHVPIIDQNPRRGEKLPMDSHRAVRYRERSAAERVMSNIKDNYGGRFVRVRGAAKVMCHLMFGIVAMTARQIFALLR